MRVPPRTGATEPSHDGSAPVDVEFRTTGRRCTSQGIQWAGMTTPVPTLVGANLVEFNPSRDPLGLTAHATAKLVKELAGRMSAR